MKKITELFGDASRVQKMTKRLSSEQGTIIIDYSKTHIEEADIIKWEETLEGMKIADKVKDMFGGKEINYTENRKVLHVKLRSANILAAIRQGNTAKLDSEEQSIVKELFSMRRICDSFESGKMLGASGKRIKNVVGVGIGGSDLGPRLLASALPPSPGSKEGIFRYVSNVDAQEMLSVLEGLSLEETIFVVVSKTFSTQETLENAKIALSQALSTYPEKSHAEVVRAHFLAVTAARDKAQAFGIAGENILDMWDFVGGRYSLWSCVSLTAAMRMGFSAFLELLSGASLMDSHFLNTAVQNNLPMFHAMVECKYYNEYGFNNKCVVPYDHFAKLLPFYLQQCEMESNGKSCTRDGTVLLPEAFISSGIDSSRQTGVIIWGGSGTDVQHSYFQLLHQGTVRILTEFLVPIHPRMHSERENTEGAAGKSTAHDVLVANCLAQSRALLLGKEGECKNSYFSGNRPSITVLYNKLTPYTLGMLLALYEHKVFVQGQLWRINSYDQFGVELGKKIGKEILAQIESSASASSFDASTAFLLHAYQENRN